MAGSIRTEAVVLRSMRYGEADRILHLLTPRMGRVSAIAKGVRRTRSRFGGRLEPLARVALLLHEGRSDLYTVTAADTVAAHPTLRAHGACLDAASRACDAVARLTEPGDGNVPTYNLLVNELALLDARPELAGLPHVLAFRLKLLLAIGFAPALGACANCGEREHLSGFSGAAGGVVCGACEGSAFPLSQEGHDFLIMALGTPLAETPAASDLALRQAERAIAETVEHHAHVRLRPAAAR
jgi:DNA repair protein RecO (recombination protein O)